MTFTQAAVDHLRSLQITILRISVKGGGCSGYQYAMEPETEREPRPTDKVFVLEEPHCDEQECINFGIKVYVDSVSYMYLKGTQLNYKSGLLESGFEFNNANAKRTCGCGSSFSV